MMWLVWMTEESAPIAVVADERHAAFIVYCINEFDKMVGAELAAWYSPANDPQDERYEAKGGGAQ